MTIHLSDKSKVLIVSQLCLLALIIALKNVLHVPVETLTSDVVLYIIIYSMFGVLFPDHLDATARSRLNNPWFYYLLIVMVTAAIVALYAL